MITVESGRSARGWLPRIAAGAVWLLPLVALYAVARVSFLLFHISAEIFAILVAILIHILATRTYKHSNSDFLLFLGLSYICIAFLDFAHTLTYSGMNVIAVDSPNVPTQLWIAARSLQAAVLLAATFVMRHRVRRGPVLVVLSLVTLGLGLSILVFRNFPTCYVVGKGLTPFKATAEGVIMVAMAAAMLRLRGQKVALGESLYGAMMVSTGLAILSELAFTFYVDVYGILNFIGHVLRILSSFVLLSEVVVRGIDLPYQTISDELKVASTTDYLTGLLNRRGFMELAARRVDLARRQMKAAGLLLIDLDDFKGVNDTLGHARGDAVLRGFADVLRNCVRESDLLSRLGGDEFVVLAITDAAGAGLVAERLRAAVDEWQRTDDAAALTNLSIGTAVWEAAPAGAMEAELGVAPDAEAKAVVERLLKAADDHMYLEKRAKPDVIAAGR